MEINDITAAIIGASIRIHTSLGPGLLESVYQRCLVWELRNSGFHLEAEVSIPICYAQNLIIEDAFRIDLLVEDIVVVELKAVEVVMPVHKKQLLTYLKLTGKPVGLLINFNSVVLKDGIERLVNKYAETNYK